MEIDLNGTKNKTNNEKKYSIEEDSYEAMLSAVSEPFITKGYEETDPDQEKIKLTFDVNLGSIQNVKVFEGDDAKTEPIDIVPLEMYVTTKISKGSGKYSNSKLYDVIDKLGLLEVLNKDQDIITDAKVFVEWLKRNAINSVSKVQVQNSKTSGISRISKINRLIKNPNIVTEEKVE